MHCNENSTNLILNLCGTETFNHYKKLPPGQSITMVPIETPLGSLYVYSETSKTRNPEHFKVNMALTERYKKSSVPYMQRLLNQLHKENNSETTHIKLT